MILYLKLYNQTVTYNSELIKHINILDHNEMKICNRV